jgi:23S rRNA (cytidine1920-2'-O)/16S rRNA (cytidine1409-2'-O)-methyltransferase
MAKLSTRLDKLLVDRGLASSRERALALILGGRVFVDGNPAIKAGQQVSPESDIKVSGDDLPFVSRGGLKLQHALDFFSIDVTDMVAMDVGASTGGFTDCLLQRGAKRVYAVDVGYGQLAWKLRQDTRVITIERQNIRYLSSELVPEEIGLAVIDTSFISLRIVVPAVTKFLKSGAVLVALIKPQFEAGREHVGKGGVIRDSEVHELVCRSVRDLCSGLGLEVWGVTPSPILGPKGNREFLLAGRWAGDHMKALP